MHQPVTQSLLLPPATLATEIAPSHGNRAQSQCLKFPIACPRYVPLFLGSGIARLLCKPGDRRCGTTVATPPSTTPSLFLSLSISLFLSLVLFAKKGLQGTERESPPFMTFSEKERGYDFFRKGKGLWPLFSLFLSSFFCLLFF